MQDRLANHDVTVHKLRKLLGIEKSTESQSNVIGKASKGSKAARTKPRKALPRTTQVTPTVVIHPMTDIAKGDDCPQCETGKVYKAPPSNLLRISGHSPFVPEQHVMEHLRCNACGAYFTATLPDNVLADGEVGQKYRYSARVLMAIHKYFAGLPYYRQGSLQQLLGVSISASTSCDQTELVADAIYPVYQHLLSLAGNAKHYYMDDTTHRILDATPIEKKVRGSDKTQLRSGVYASGIIATLESDHDVVLFDTSIGHAGEFIDQILTHRHENTPVPIIMSDALGSNKPSVCIAILALCNSHARRQFADVIWVVEHETVDQSLNPAQQLAYHQQHSLPVAVG
ncbi:IS66 family transposase [Glaciecola punicea]|uniref:IS66 family transposase n=1 Tax=Glaciecola punicea TaxID=56804 RepID=UPI001FD24362|nr:transposase [Glaciecola punicea]